jgi:hypothetical protein
MSKALVNGWVLCLAAAGCSTSAVDETEIANVEQNELGIARIKVEHRLQGSDRILDVRGLDASGDEVASATLRTGMVRYSPDPDLMAPGWSAGTELTISAGIDTASFVSPDRLPHEVRTPDETALATFVSLRAVANEIQQEAGIRFSAVQNTDEVAFVAGNCAGWNFPTANGNPSQCCQDGSNHWFKIGGGSNINKLGFRTVNPMGGAYGGTCRGSDGVALCTGIGCTYGPCATKVNPISGTTNTTAAVVFTPSSASTQCGADSNGTTSGGIVELTEAYNGSQSTKVGVVASCPWTDCDQGDGRPGPGFWLTLKAYCQYSVTCDAAHLTVQQSFWAHDNGTKTIRASSSPYGVTEWAFSGGNCSGTSCDLTATTDVTITGTFCDGTGCMGGGGGGDDGGGGGLPGCTFCPDEY